MSEIAPPPEGFSPTTFDLDIPFVTHFFQTYQRSHHQGVDIGTWVTENCCNAGGMAHGGLLMTLGDYATTKATFEVMGSCNRFTVHMNFNMNFYAPARLGAWVEARAKVNRQGSSVVYTSCDYYADGDLIGHADAILKSSERRKKAT